MEQEQFVFKGNASEWFGIWIVNLLLSIVTLGIYSAWAKVRRKKYFYNNTYVSGRNFDYHATGMQILIGRAIVVAALIIYEILPSFHPYQSLVMVVALLLISPWLMVRSIMFNARMSSWSSVRFNFVGSVGKAFLVYLIYPIGTLLTLFTTLPFLDRAFKNFGINNHRLGTAVLTMQSPIGPFYKAFLASIAWILVVIVLTSAVRFSSVEFAGAMENPDAASEAANFTVGLIYMTFFIGILPATFIYEAMVRNTVYNATSLEGGHEFRSNVSALQLLWIAVSNMLVVVLTIGLMLPWAQIRLARYLADHTTFIPGDSVDNFVGIQQAEGSAFGDAYTDLEGIDLGLPV